MLRYKLVVTVYCVGNFATFYKLFAKKNRLLTIDTEITELFGSDEIEGVSTLFISADNFVELIKKVKKEYNRLKKINGVTTFFGAYDLNTPSETPVFTEETM